MWVLIVRGVFNERLLKQVNTKSVLDGLRDKQTDEQRQAMEK